MAKRLQVIDDLVRDEHYYLSADDICIFYGEYTAKRGYAFSKTNSLICNLKKKMDRQGTAEWPHKMRAIQTAAQIFRTGIKAAGLAECTLVPMPPSKVRGDPEYDDRMLQVVKHMGNGLDVRELLEIRHNLTPSHERNDRPNPDELYDAMQVNEDLLLPAPKKILLVDDVLTAGSHFVAAKRHLAEHFPDVLVIGLFVARRKVNTDDVEMIGDI